MRVNRRNKTVNNLIRLAMDRMNKSPVYAVTTTSSCPSLGFGMMARLSVSREWRHVRRVDVS